MVKVSALVLLSCIVFVGVAGAQSAPASSPTTSRSPVELVGCVSNQPGASGAFTFDESSGSKYKLTGKSVRKYAGQMVRLVGGPQGRKLSVSGGLWPSPGGGGAGVGSINLPEFRVVSVRTVDGSCSR
jgi:hypothetical protein